MDFQRILILLGMAVTAYMLILAWNDDYGQQSRLNSDFPVTLEQEDTLYQEIETSTAGHLTLENSAVDVPTLTAEKQQYDQLPELAEPLMEQRLVHITTDVFNLKIDRLGGDIVHGALPKYPQALETPDIPFVLLDQRNQYSAQSGLIGKNGTDTSNGRPLFSVAKSHYDIGSNDQLVIDFKLFTETGVEIIKRFTFNKGDYLINIEYIVSNQTSDLWQAAFYTQIKRNGQEPVSAESSGMGMKPYTGAATFNIDSPYTKLSFDDIAEDTYQAKVEAGYMALVQHYFVSAWVPADRQVYKYQARKLADKDIYLFGFTSPLWEINPGETATQKASFYLGPKNQDRLEEISDGLNLTVDYGFLWWLAQPLFQLLAFIHGFVNNWGIAIIFLTIFVKSLLYPLSAASFRSMAKMRKLQPEMARLKERFGDDKQKFSQAMMELYKKEGANPLGGCLPMLAQMPVFLALYWSLMESVELRQAPFFLWINDLSAMDPYFVLPILMGISMFVTQMLQPEPPDPIQAKVFKLMPIMFTFFFLWFPSGLVLYWFINNLLSILQQWYVTRQIEKSS
ncbi:MAG: membrane protein insertase YidC [Pseudomonadales bacterium]|nr:membrane protein insertase YidC [Pseudomonadales bacterium]